MEKDAGKLVLSHFITEEIKAHLEKTMNPGLLANYTIAYLLDSAEGHCTVIRTKSMLNGSPNDIFGTG